MHKIKDSAEKNAERVESVLQDLSKRASSAMDNVMDRGEDIAEELRRRGESVLHEAQDRGEGVWKDVKEWVKKHPGEAVAWAALGGYLLHAYWNRED